MSHFIRYDDDDNLVIINYQGNVTLSDIKAGALDGMRLAKDRKCMHFLIDGRQAKFPLSSMDIFKLPEILANAALGLEIDISRSRRAVVVDQKQPELLFIESVIQEHEQVLKVFDDIDKAKEWLLINY